jgi:hypothetical protein
VDDAEHENAVAHRRTADGFRSGDELLLASLIAPAMARLRQRVRRTQ